MDQQQLGRIESGIEELIRIRADHEVRLRALEVLAAQAAGGWKIIAILVAVSTAVGSLMSWVALHFKT